MSFSDETERGAPLSTGAPPARWTFATQGDLGIQRPEGWLDKSVVILTAPPTGDRFPPSLVVTRAPLGPTESIDQYADKSVLECAAEFEGFELIERTHIAIDGRSLPCFRFRWDSPRGSATQHQVYAAGSEGTILCLTFSSMTPDADAAKRTFDKMLASLQLGSVR